MKYTSIFEKVACLSKIISSEIIYPIFLAILLMLVAMLFIKKIKNKKIFTLILISYITLFAITIVNNFKTLSKIFDSISTNLFTNIYFPSTYTYLFVLLVIDIVTITSLLNRKLEKVYKIVNTTCFLITKFILVLILDNIAKNNIDLFNKKSLFGNANLLVLLETSINIFIVWLIILFVIYLTNKVTENITLKQTNKIINIPEEIPNTTLVVENANSSENDCLDVQENNVPQELLTNSNIEIENKIIHENIINSNIDLNNDFNLEDLAMPRNKNVHIVSPVNNENEALKPDANILLDKLLNNELPLIKEETPKPTVEVAPRKEAKDNYTLNDYKIFNKILKDIKEFNNSNIISIDRNLDLILKAKYTEAEYNLFQGMLKNYSN